ncbi:MAG: VOC family protein [Ilumatobacter sp.]|uniref:VOC family protein n=1 Tax=Ilumatobacter sp. TaxID=1967498 RepID=UPI0032983D99
MNITISLASFISEEFVALFEFYSTTFELAEVEELHSDIFRGAHVGDMTLGFSAPVVYEMLAIQEWSDPKGTTQYLTFEAASDDEVSTLTERAVVNGARLLHDPYETYYGAFQSVLADPDGNVFRINHFR